jgi:hypothetical protein
MLHLAKALRVVHHCLDKDQKEKSRIEPLP